MTPFAFVSAVDIGAAMDAVMTEPSARFIAGGTNILDLMKDDVERPTLLVDITHLPLRGIEKTASGIRLGALATMADVADDLAIRTAFPAVSQALLAGASPQLRNMATIGGNILQRTRCAYFRDVAQSCNKRKLGSGCSAIGGENRSHAVIGTSPQCICTHPSDFAVALLATDAIVNTRGPRGARAIAIADFHLLPGATPGRETLLEHGELVESIDLPASALAQRSTYIKVRDRASYEFALVSAAAALDVADGMIRGARLALGGVAPKPWRASEAEALLVGKSATTATFTAAAAVATRGMHGFGQNDFKITLARRTIERALATVGGAA